MSLKNPVTPPGIDPGAVRLVAQRLNHYATPGPLILLCEIQLMLCLIWLEFCIYLNLGLLQLNL